MQYIRLLSRSRSGKSVPKEESSDNLPQNDSPENQDILPQIVITKIECTDGVETTLTSSFDSGEINQRNGDNERKSIDEEHESNDHKLSCSSRSLQSKYSRDSTTASVATSVSQNTTTMDVHECNSSLCTLCNSFGKKGITFVNVTTLDTNMIGKLRSQPLKWYELGQSFDELYREANRPDRERKGRSRTECDAGSGHVLKITPCRIDP